MTGPDWDVDSERLQEQLARLLERLRDEARQRRPLRASDWIGADAGARPEEVLTELAHFETTLERGIRQLDATIPVGSLPDERTLGAVLDLCAWAHAEWVRILPFANGSGRTARLWANVIAMRYELPPFVRLRPRPNHGYAAAAERAMHGDWEPTARVFGSMLDALLREA